MKLKILTNNNTMMEATNIEKDRRINFKMVFGQPCLNKFFNSNKGYKAPPNNSKSEKLGSEFIVSTYVVPITCIKEKEYRANTIKSA